MAEKERKKPGRKTLSEQQKEFCKLVASQGKEPMEAMLEVYPNRKTYSKGNQNMLLKKLKEHPLIQQEMERLFKIVRENEVLGDLYNFDSGVRYLHEEIERANRIIEERGFSESMHRVILTSVQELNRMYGFNIVDRNGNSTNNGMNVTFVNVNQEGGVVFEAKDGGK